MKPSGFYVEPTWNGGKDGEYLCAGGMDILSLICFPCGKGPSVISVQVFSAERQKKI